MEPLHLRSVNWEHGMLLTPDHFLRQERYLESAAAWATRYLASADGLIGGGVRLPTTELGAVRYDPIVVLQEDNERLRITVSQCRGLTPSGLAIDIDSPSPLSGQWSKTDLAGVSEATIYVFHEAGKREPVDGIDGATDSYNPQMKSERRAQYRLLLDPTAGERRDALAVARMQRPAVGVHYGRDPRYIPHAVSLSAHSELTAGWRRIVEQVHTLNSEYLELHRAMREFLVLFTERGIETEIDRDSIAFAERMVMALQETSYAVLDQTQTPAGFFAALRRLLHQAAIFFDLSPGMQSYYQTLRETGETELARLVESQKYALKAGRTLDLDDNLQVELDRNLRSLEVLAKLERALEGKYIDFRRSPSLDGANFVFDRGGKVLYRLAAKPARVQGIADESTIYFSQLRLEGRDRYRLILVGDRSDPFQQGTKVGIEIRLNEGSGFRREAIILTGEAKLDGQYNIEFDFEAPDVPTITDVRVMIPSAHGIRTALLFIRHRFYAGMSNGGGALPAVRESYGLSENLPGNGGAVQAEAAGGGFEPLREDRTAALAGQPVRREARGQEMVPPWMPRNRAETPPPEEREDGDSRPPRRRRLE